MTENRVFKFKQFYAKFLKIDKYMREKRNHINPNSKNWKEIEEKFLEDSVAPLERIWKKLNIDEKEQFFIQMGWRYNHG